MTPPTPATINQRNTEFWNVQIPLMEQRTADSSLLEQAISDLDSESLRAVPIYNRMTFETALEQAVQAKERFHTRLRDKADKQQRLILWDCGYSSQLVLSKAISEYLPVDGKTVHQ